MTEAEREKIKLRASYLNGLAIALMAVGGIGPYVAISQIYRSGGASLLDGLTTVLFALGFCWLSLQMHDRAVKTLDKLGE